MHKKKLKDYLNRYGGNAFTIVLLILLGVILVWNSLIIQGVNKHNLSHKHVLNSQLNDINNSIAHVSSDVKTQVKDALLKNVNIDAQTALKAERFNVMLQVERCFQQLSLGQLKASDLTKFINYNDNKISKLALLIKEIMASDNKISTSDTMLESMLNDKVKILVNVVLKDASDNFINKFIKIDKLEQGHKANRNGKNRSIDNLINLSLANYQYQTVLNLLENNNFKDAQIDDLVSILNSKNSVVIYLNHIKALLKE